MKYKDASKTKRKIKNLAIFIKNLQKGKNLIKNPIKETINLLIDKASQIDTTRKSYGIQKNRAQFYNPRTKRWVLFDTKRHRIIRQRSLKGIPYKNVKIISNPKRRSNLKTPRKKK